MDEVSQRFRRVLGETVSHHKFVTAEMFSTFGFPVCQELASMVLYWRDVRAQHRDRHSVDETKPVSADPTSFDEYLLVITILSTIAEWNLI